MVGGRIVVMQKKSSKISKCLCGEIKIKVKGKLGNVINCHCSQCRKTHDNYATYTYCPEENVTFISKKTLKWYQSSNIAKRGFCSRCGASQEKFDGYRTLEAVLCHYQEDDDDKSPEELDNTQEKTFIKVAGLSN